MRYGRTITTISPLAEMEIDAKANMVWTMRPQAPSRLLRAYLETTSFAADRWDADAMWRVTSFTVGNRYGMAADQFPMDWLELFLPPPLKPHRFPTGAASEDVTLVITRTGPSCRVRGVAFFESLTVEER